MVRQISRSPQVSCLLYICCGTYIYIFSLRFLKTLAVAITVGYMLLVCECVPLLLSSVQTALASQFLQMTPTYSLTNRAPNSSTLVSFILKNVTAPIDHFVEDMAGPLIAYPVSLHFSTNHPISYTFLSLIEKLCLALAWLCRVII